MGLAPHQPDSLEGLKLAGDAGGGDAEPVGELDAAEPPVGSVAELEQEREIGEREPVCAERGVDLAGDDRPREREVQNG